MLICVLLFCRRRRRRRRRSCATIFGVFFDATCSSAEVFFVFQNHLFSLFESRKKRGYLLSIGEEKRDKELGV